MIPSAVPRKVASVFPSRAAASTHTNRRRAFRRWNILQFAQHASVIGLVVRVSVGFVRLCPHAVRVAA